MVIGQCLVTARAQTINVVNNGAAVKGQSIQIICQGFIELTTLTSVYKETTPTALTQCMTNRCLTKSVDRYNFSADQNNLYINITLLNRQQDQTWWTCNSSATKSARFYLEVITLPTRLQKSPNPSENQDLALTSTSLSCQTDCCIPQPNIEWFYIFKEENTKQKWTNDGVPGSSTDMCKDSENVYNTALMLPRYTTFPGNLNVSIKFLCAIRPYSGLANELVSASSVDINFAVRVTDAVLRLGTTELKNSSTLDVTLGENTTLTCMPSTSRPEATLVWYINNIQQQSSTSTSFVLTPRDSDHAKQIYCKAFNFENVSLSVFSERPTLNVAVKVITVTLKDGSDNPTTSIDVTENQSKTLTCITSTSRPTATIVWYIGNTERYRSSGSNSFTFIPTNTDHNMNIYCKAFNLQPESQAVISAAPSLYVKVEASQPTLTNTTSGSLVLLSGDTVTLECVSSPTRPPVLVVWKLGNTQYINVTNTDYIASGGLNRRHSVLTITPTNIDNGKTVTCETYVVNQNSKPQAQLQLQIYWPPSEIAINADVAFPWFEGNTSRYLDCSSSDNGNPAAVAKWTTPIGQQALGNPRRLELPTITSEHNGLDISCRLENEYTTRKGIVVSSQVKLPVEYYPVIKFQVDGENVETVTKIEGQNVIAICNASGNPYPTVQWRKYGTHQLLLKDLNRTNDGIYECVATAKSVKYGTISSQRKLNLTVNYAPNAAVEFSGSLQEGDNMAVRCNATGKPVSYVFTNLTQNWNGLILKIFDINQNGEAVVTSSTIQDSGNYTCYVNNGIPDKTGQIQQSATAEVLIKGKPKISQKASSMFAGKIGESVNITIPFYSFPAIKEFSFRYQNGTKILDSNKYVVKYARAIIGDIFHNVLIQLDGYIGVFYITEQEEYDFGNYSLILKNDFGETEWKFVHVSKNKPQPPKSFTLNGLTNDIPIFMLQGGFNGGLLQTFLIEIKPTRSDKWIEMLKIHEEDVHYKLPNGSYLFSISGLSPETYLVRAVAENEMGRSDDQGLTVEITIQGPHEPSSSLPVGAIAGGIGSALLVFLIAVGIVILWKRRSRDSGESRTKLNKKHIQNSDDSSDDEVVENLAYVSADDIKTTKFGGTSDATYSHPIKKSNATDIPFLANKTNDGADPFNLYAQPAKKDNKDKPIHGEKKTGQKKKADVYENAEPVVKRKPKDTDENLYENPEPVKGNAKKNVNKDGLIYADLTFDNSSKGQKKLVIHGLDDMTEYGQIDFSKKAERLPDSDEESKDK